MFDAQFDPGLRDVRVLSVAQDSAPSGEGGCWSWPPLVVRARAETAICPPPARCRGCHLAGCRTIRIIDVPHGNRPIHIDLSLPRRRDSRHNAVHTAPRPADIHPSLGCTWRLLRYITGEIGRTPYATIAARLAVSEAWVRAMAADLLAAADREYRPPAPRVLCIDDCHALRSPCLVVTDGETGDVIELASGISGDHARALLLRCSAGHTSVVVTDLSRALRAAVRAVLPQVVHVADRWHVLRLWNAPLEEMAVERERALKALHNSSAVRRQLRFDRSILCRPHHELGADEKVLLAALLAQSPALEEAHGIVQEIHRLYGRTSRAAAVTAYRRLIARLSPAARARFRGPIATTEEWHEPIFAWFSATGGKPSNGRAENNNKHLKALAKNHRITAFASLRLRALAAYGPPGFAANLIAAATPAEAAAIDTAASAGELLPCQLRRQVVATTNPAGPAGEASSAGRCLSDADRALIEQRARAKLDGPRRKRRKKQRPHPDQHDLFLPRLVPTKND